MEKQVNNSLSITGILRESFKTSIRNGKLVLSIMLFVFLSFCLLELGGHLVLTPVVQDLVFKSTLVEEIQFHSMTDSDETTIRGIKEDIKILLLLKTIFLFLSFATLLFFSVATISSSSEAYTAKVLNLKDMVGKIRGKWKAPIITSIYMSLMSLSIFSLLFIFISVLVSLMGEDYRSHSLKIAASILVVAACYVYVAAVWMVSLVVSILENGTGGLKAIDRAGEVMKGRRVQAYVIMLVLVMASGAIYVISLVMTKGIERGVWTRLAIRAPVIWLQCLVKFLMFVVYTVFYHESKKSDKGEGVEGKLGFYVPISSDEV